MSNVRGEHIPPALASSIIASVRDAHRQPLRQPDLPPEVAEDQAIANYLKKIDRKPGGKINE